MSPFLTVGILTVLWLIVVVPMVLRRSDEHARERSIDQFGRAMRALGRRSTVRSSALAADSSDSRSEVFVSGVTVRRPVATAEEALLYPERSDLSPARAAMMARRRRALTVLGVGAAVSTGLALVLGGTSWLFALVFATGLVGYCLFLRAQAQRDRQRRELRQARARSRTRSYDASVPAPEPVPDVVEDETVVRIDDDDLALVAMDTIDLTGLYAGEMPEVAQRRAS